MTTTPVGGTAERGHRTERRAVADPDPTAGTPPVATTGGAGRGSGLLHDAVGRTFSSLRNPNYRRYFTGQSVSMIGTWMQSVAQAWLVLQLTGSPSWLGVVVALQTLPVLVGGPYGGVVADRMDKRRLLLVTQAAKGSIGLAFGLLTVTGLTQLWMVCVLATLFGVSNVFDSPVRQSFLHEMVGAADLRNAVSLNSVLSNAARAVGPAVAGVLIATVGVGVCFLIDAASYVAVIIALLRLDVGSLERPPPTPRARGQLREGLSYVRRTPELFIPLLMMAVIGMLSYEFTVVLPVVAERTFHGGADTYGFMTSAMGAGAVVGGLWVAGRARTGLGPLARAAAIFGVALLAAALAPTLWVCLVALLFVGGCSVSFLAVATTTLQLGSAPHMRGRVMSLWSVAFLGSTPIGGPIVGNIVEHLGARYGLATGGVAALGAAALAALWLSRRALSAPRVAADLDTVELATADVAAGSR